MQIQQMLFTLIKGFERLWPAVFRIRSNMSLKETNRALYGRIPSMSLIVMVLVTFGIWTWSYLANFGRPPFQSNVFNFFRVISTFLTFAPFLFGLAVGVRIRRLKHGVYLNELTREYAILRPVYDAMLVPFFLWSMLLALAVTGLQLAITTPWQDSEAWSYWWAVLPIQVLGTTAFNIFAAVVASFFIWRSESIASGISRLLALFWGMYMTLFILNFIPFVGDTLQQILDFQMHARSGKDGVYALIQTILFLGLTGAIFAAGDEHFERFCIRKKQALYAQG